MLKSQQATVRNNKVKNKQAQINANIQWPDRIWVYKRVPKGPYRKCNENKLKYTEHYDIRLVPSDHRYGLRQKGWKIHPDQDLPQEILNWRPAPIARPKPNPETTMQPMIRKKTKGPILEN